MLVYKMYPTSTQLKELDKLKEKNPSIKFIDTNIKQDCFNTPSLAIFSRYWATVKQIVRVRIANNLSTYVMLTDCMDCMDKVILVSNWDDIKSFDDSLKDYIISQELEQLADKVKSLVLENKLLMNKLDRYNNFLEFIEVLEWELETIQEDDIFDIDIDISSQKLTYLKMKSYKHTGKPTAYMEEGHFISYEEERTHQKYIQTCYDTMLAWLQLQYYKLANIEPMKRLNYTTLQVH